MKIPAYVICVLLMFTSPAHAYEDQWVRDQQYEAERQADEGRYYQQRLDMEQEERNREELMRQQQEADERQMEYRQEQQRQNDRVINPACCW